MRTLFSLGAIIVAIIIILAAISVVCLSDDDENFVCSITIDKPEYKIKDEPDNGSDIPEEESKRNVFIEEGTATWCVNCPNIAEVLHELYESGDYNFYYVSMIEDKNVKAQKRLDDDYNIYGYPTVFIDGGYKIVYGEQGKSEYTNAIRSAESRDVPKISVSVEMSYDNDTDELETKVLVENFEDCTYDGALKVYLTEKVSRWVNRYKTNDGDIVPYHFGFLDYIIERNIEVGANSNNTYNEIKKLTDFDVSDIAPEEIFVIAVVFNSDSVNADSAPDNNREGDFVAHYADATATSELVEGGNTPPIVGFTLPEFGKINLRGNPLFNTLFGGTYLIGKSTIKAVAEDDEEVVKVEFYIDDVLVSEDTEAPYEYNFSKVDAFKHLFRRRTLRVVAYDNDDRSSSTEIEVFTVLL